MSLKENILHGKLATSNHPGIKQSEIKDLKRILQMRLSSDEIISLELAESLAVMSVKLRTPLSLVVNRRGHIISLSTCEPYEVELPELKQFRQGSSGLCGHRIIYTSFLNEAANKNVTTHKNNTNTDSNSNSFKTKQENLLCLVKNRLDLLVQIEVNEKGSFSKKAGEHGLTADKVNLIHLLPKLDNSGNLWEILPSMTVRQSMTQNFEYLIDSWEEEFQKYHPTRLISSSNQEIAVLVGLITEECDQFETEDDLDELAQLARTAGASVVGRLTQNKPKPDPKFFLGSGKIQELSLLVQETKANLVIFDNELSPTQESNIEDALGVKVLDRTELILDIFAQRAQTKEGKLQVELAQLEYLLPKLAGSRAALSRLGGGIGTRGPGETKLEVDRRRLRQRIDVLRKEANHISIYRQVQRNKRLKSGCPILALTGYTNSGKSTLLNALTKSDVFVEDKLFATLDPTTRRTFSKNGKEMLITDTVGFIKKLPTSLVTAFKATLEELVQADILLVVVDASHPNSLEQIGSVYDVLSELKVIDKPMITILNKADVVRPEDLRFLSMQTPNPVIVSAKNRTGLLEILWLAEEIQKLIELQNSKSSA